MKARSKTHLHQGHQRLSQEQAEAIWAQRKEAVILALMELSARAARSGPPGSVTPGPHTPSGAIPPHQKPAKTKRRRKLGAKPGHPGRRRPAPERITQRVQHSALTHFPDCGTRVHASRRSRIRYVEDVPEVQPEVTEHTIPRHWCPACNKPVVDDAVPGATFGRELVTLTAWLHYGLGTAISQVLSVLCADRQVCVAHG